MTRRLSPSGLRTALCALCFEAAGHSLCPDPRKDLIAVLPDGGAGDLYWLAFTLAPGRRLALSLSKDGGPVLAKDSVDYPPDAEWLRAFFDKAMPLARRLDIHKQGGKAPRKENRR
jgi:hypothetical protein